MTTESRKMTLNMRLLRSTFSTAEAFRAKFAPGGERELTASSWEGATDAALYVGQIYSKSPDWANFIGVDTSPSLVMAGAGAIVVIPTKGRKIFVSFGQAHLALNDDAFERQFGLKVALNTVPENKLRTLDLATPDAVTFQKRVQASKDSSLSDFGVNMLRDLARVAGGTPEDTDFATFVAGKDSLSIACEISQSDLVKKCEQVLTEYNKDTYSKKFPWVDNLTIVTEKDVIDDLDNKILDALNELLNGSNSDLHLAPPEIVDYSDGSDLHYNGIANGTGRKKFTTLSINDYVTELRTAGIKPDLGAIREKHKIAAKSPTSSIFNERWSIYDCFVFEAIRGSGNNQENYALFAGSWYKINKKFKDDVEDFYKKIARHSIVGQTNCSNEQDLIKHLSSTRQDLVKLDQTKINPEDVRYGFLEPCDFFSNKKEFIHLKDGHSSGPISHLWSQGYVSADAFVRDEKFRNDLRKTVNALSPTHATLLPKKGKPYKRADYTVIFGIMRHRSKSGSLDIPFFSKVSLRASAEQIMQLDISLGIEIIEKI